MCSRMSELLHFSGDGHRKFRDKADVPRDFVMRDLSWQNSRISSGVLEMPGFSWIHAQISSPSLGSGTPHTCTASTLA